MGPARPGVFVGGGGVDWRAAVHPAAAAGEAGDLNIRNKTNVFPKTKNIFSTKTIIAGRGLGRVC